MRLNLKSRFLAKEGAKKGKDDLWPFLKELLEEGLEARRPEEQRWIVNLAFLMGRQYTFFNQSAYTLQQIKRIRGRIRNVDNKLIGYWRRQVADLIKNKPNVSIVPDSDSDEDVQAAKMGDKVMRSFWHTNEMRGKIRTLAGWIYATGNGFLDDRWDEKRGPLALDEDSGELVYQGDADVGVWSPFDIVVPFTGLTGARIHELPWIIKMKWRDLEYVTKHWKKGGQVAAEDSAQFMVDTQMITGAIGAVGRKNEGAMVLELLMKPNSMYKKGLRLVGANGIVLEKGDYPYDEYNLEHFKDLDMPGKFWGSATMEHAIGLQKVWNRSISSIDEFNRTMAKGKWLVPRGSKIAIEPDDTHGERMVYTPVLGYKPEHLSIKGLPATYDKMLAVAQGSMNDLFSMHEVTHGTNKSDLRSGEMVELLREQDAHGMIPTHAVFEESLERVMRRVLRRIQAGYKTERMVKVLGKEDEWEVFAFKGADLRNNTDVRVVQQSTLPESKSARQSQVLRRFELGLYGDPADPEVRRHVMNMLEDAVVSDIYGDTKAEETYSRWENRLIVSANVTMQLVNAYDNHGLHLREHNHFRKSMEYQRIKVRNPEAFAALEAKFERHVGMHRRFLQEQQEAQMRQQAEMERLLKAKGGE